MTLDDTLRSLGVPPDAPRALAMLPLVEVAWADGIIQDEEREAIVRLAVEHYQLGEDGSLLLETWLTHRPSEAYVSRGRDALLDLVRQGRLGLEVADEDVARGVQDHALQVAKSAGGWFGFRAVDGAEKAALEAIAKAFDALHDAHVGAGDGVPDFDPAEDDRTDPFVPPVTGRYVRAEVPVDLPVAERPSLVRLDTREVLPLTHLFTVGRSRTNDLSLPTDPLASRQHAQVLLDGERVVLRDLDSVHGTWVDDERIVARRLFGGEVLRIGGCQLVLIGC